MNNSGKQPKQSKPLVTNMSRAPRGSGGPTATRVLCETVDKEELCREKFETAAMFMKMPRNPIQGDLTSREDAEYAIPLHHSIMLKMEEQKRVYVEPQSPPRLARYVDEREMTFARANPKVRDVLRKMNNIKQPQLETLRNKAAFIDKEIEQMQKLAEFRRSQLLSSPGSTVSALPNST